LLLLLVDPRDGGGWFGGSSSNDVGATVVAGMKKVAAQESRKRRWSGAGDEGGARKGKEVRRGLGGTRRISPLQRILSALHLFQDVVFPLRRESHTRSPLESPVSSFPAPFLAASATFAIGAEMSSATPSHPSSHLEGRAIYFMRL